jgi:hypothetical protein
MWCRCCKKKTLDDDDRIIKQSPLICEDIESPTDNQLPSLATAQHPNSKMSKNKDEKGPGTVELSPTVSKEPANDG